jgi:cell division protein FtsX
MRYVIAMGVAIALALVATLFVSPQLASMAVARYTFDSPDEVGNLEDGVYMLSNLLALLIGWVIGWFVGGRLVRPHTPPA